MSTYADFIAQKKARVPAAGIDATDVHWLLFDWQAELVHWACKVGRAAIWADTGLGKTLMQVEWIRNMSADGRGLIVAPLAVCQQTIREAAKVGQSVTYVHDGSEVAGPGLYITNYERVERLDPLLFNAVVLDEASILKQSDGKTRTMLIEHFREVPYRLACTATPAPNDPEELTNQAEFLGHMTRVHMLAAYFIHDTDGWREKGHARGPMIEWMTTWAVAVRKPSDLGYTDEGYDLPGLNIVTHLIDVPMDDVDGQLFATDLGGVGGRAAVRKKTLHARVMRAVELVKAEPDEPWLLWCGLNDEAKMLAEMTGGLNIHGSLSPEEKADGLLGFADGKYQIIVTKPGIASQGLNYQHCARMAFVGLSDSYEQYYQAMRRCHRFGQTRIVDAHIILSELEGQIAGNISRKERQSNRHVDAMIEYANRKREARHD